MGGKWLQLLTEIAPGVKRVAIMFNPDTAPYGRSYYLPSFEAAARSLKVEPITAPVHSDAEIETVITSLGREPGGGLVVMPDAFMTAHRAPIILLAARNNVPAVYSDICLCSETAVCFPTDRIRRDMYSSRRFLCRSHSPWRKAGDLPVQLPVKFEMAVNLKTAKALGLAVPQSILLSADEVIELQVLCLQSRQSRRRSGSALKRAEDRVSTASRRPIMMPRNYSGRKRS